MADHVEFQGIFHGAGAGITAPPIIVAVSIPERKTVVFFMVNFLSVRGVSCLVKWGGPSLPPIGGKVARSAGRMRGTKGLQTLAPEGFPAELTVGAGTIRPPLAGWLSCGRLIAAPTRDHRTGRRGRFPLSGGNVPKGQKG